MISSDSTLDIVYTLLYGLSVFNNIFFILYLIIQRLLTSADRLIFSVTVVQLLLVVLGVPFVYDVWVGEPYKYGAFSCRALVPVHSILDFTEAFLFSMMAVFVADKLRGDRDVKWRVFLVCIYVASIIMMLPYFGVMVLEPTGTETYNNKEFCLEDWNSNAERIHRVSKVLLQYVIPFGIIVYHHLKGYRIVKYIMHYLNTNKSSTRYQSFSKVVADPHSQSALSHLRFTESEEMNLEMSHLYQKHNSISTIQKDETTSNISVQIYTNEVEMDKIDHQSPLWRGRSKPGEYQKTIVSIKWFRYTRNIYQAFLISAVFYLVVLLPFQIFLLYSVARSPYDFNETEKLVAKVTYCLRLVPCMVNPWFFMLGVFKYRKSLFGRCYRQPIDFVILPQSK